MITYEFKGQLIYETREVVLQVRLQHKFFRSMCRIMRVDHKKLWRDVQDGLFR